MVRWNDKQWEAFHSSVPSLPSSRVIALMDYTLLDAKADSDTLDPFCQKARAHPVAAICVYANHLPRFVQSGCKRATVVNFPKGVLPDHAVLGQISAIAKNYMLEEVDYVFPYAQYQQGEEDSTLKQVKQVVELCHQKGLRLKVIMESGSFLDRAQLYRLSRALCDLGCDFLKTSTGFYNTGARLEDALVILQAIKDSSAECGFKASGGIATKKQAAQYITLFEQILDKPAHDGCFRIGASRLLDACTI